MKRSSCSLLRTCPDQEKEKEGEKIYLRTHTYIYIQRTKGNNSTARRSSSSFKIVPATILNLKEVKDLRQCDKCSCAMFGCVLSSCCSQMEASKERFSRLWKVRLSSCTISLPTYQRTRVFCVHLRLHRINVSSGCVA